MQRLSIDVVSDVVCPWCYLGKRRLERALTLVPDVAVDIHWRPYRLDPTIPPEGIDRADYVIRKFGSLSALDQAHARLEAMGKAEGIDYRFDLIRRSPNTIDAHRLVRWAAGDGKEGAIVERLFAAYFSEGRDVGDHAVLGELASGLGMDREATERRLASDEDRSVVEDEIGEAVRIGVSGVPCFILDRRAGVMGAQSPETLAHAITKIASEGATA